MTAGWCWAWSRPPRRCPTLLGSWPACSRRSTNCSPWPPSSRPLRRHRLPDPSPTWLDRAESTRARLWLLGSVLPRAIASSVAAGRRTPESGIPAWDLGLREFGETATDELFIALSALYREVPDLDAVRASMEACARAAPELSELGVAG